MSSRFDLFVSSVALDTPGESIRRHSPIMKLNRRKTTSKNTKKRASHDLRPCSALLPALDPSCTNNKRTRTKARTRAPPLGLVHSRPQATCAFSRPFPTRETRPRLPHPSLSLLLHRTPFLPSSTRRACARRTSAFRRRPSVRHWPSALRSMTPSQTTVMMRMASSMETMRMTKMLMRMRSAVRWRIILCARGV